MRKLLFLFISLIFTLKLIGANDSTYVTIDTFFKVPLGLDYKETHKILVELGYKYDMQVSENANTTTHGYIADSAVKNLYMLVHDTETKNVFFLEIYIQ